jgi:3-oxoacyl-[acyl-carrier protein] reductase
MGAEVEPRSAYITRAEDVQALFSHAVDRFGGPEVLVNNTCGPHVGTFDNFGDKDWQAAFELVLLSLIRALRGSLPLMR